MSFKLLGMILGLTVFAYRCADDKKASEPVAPTTPAESTPATPPASSGNLELKSETVYFSYDDYTLTSDSQERLAKIADSLKANGTAAVQIEGHCDERGSIEYNMALGERRAQSVKNYLGQLGVDGARLSTISYGEEKPVAKGHNEAAWAKNRRAEFVVTKN